MSTDFYRLNTVPQIRDSSEYPHEHARRPHEKRKREGDGEEDVLIRGIGVKAFVVEHKEDRGDGNPGHQDGRYAHGVEGADPAEHAFRVEEEQPEPVGGQHERDTEYGQEPVEQGAREKRSPDGRLGRRVLQIVEQRLRRFAEEFEDLFPNLHGRRNGNAKGPFVPLKSGKSHPRSGWSGP
jgi:hypothetical protein